MGVFLAADAPFTAVAGDKLPSAGEFVDGQAAIVGAALALCHAGVKLQVADLLIGKHGGLVAGVAAAVITANFAIVSVSIFIIVYSATLCVAFPGDQSRAESAHDTCDIRANGFTVRDFFKAAQNGIIVESTALNHDLFAQFRGVGHFDYLKQGVLDHRVGQPGGDVRNTGPFFLGLFHFGVHEHGTAGA